MNIEISKDIALETMQEIQMSLLISCLFKTNLKKKRLTCKNEYLFLKLHYILVIK